MSLTIRDATDADIDGIVAYNAALAHETESKTLDQDTLRRGVAEIFRDASSGRYWIAELDGAIVGQLMITTEWSDWRNGNFWWIQSVYVAEPARGRGVFGALYRHVRTLAEAEANVCGLRLYVEDQNLGAREVYRHLGMRDAGYRVMETEIATSGEQEQC